MALHARQLHERQRVEPRRPERPKRPVQTSKRLSKKRQFFSKGEKFLLVIFFLVVVSLSTIILHKHAQVNALNREMHDITETIKQKEKENVEFSIQISEKSTHERILNKAKERGLDLKESNVKVVPGQ